MGRMAIFPPNPQMPAQPASRPASAAAHTLAADDVARAKTLADRIRTRFSQTLIGQEHLRESLILTLVAGGHILIESVPGLAKTTAAQTLATSVSGTFKRIQCTPDLMPSDIVGTQVFNFATQKFATQVGPIHANFVLLDEINQPFMVIATQNPIEEEGTFALPEAQMDRFMMKAIMNYPTADEEQRMLALLTRRGSDMLDPLQLQGDRLSIRDVEFLRAAAKRVYVSDAIMQYAVDIAATSRGAGTHPVQGLGTLVRLGASPRASIALVRIGQANALLKGRAYVIPEDVKSVVADVLRRRLVLTFEALADGVTADQVVDRIVQAVPVP